MDQLTPHLTIPRGEKHVTPLSQALLPIMTGRGIALKYQDMHSAQ